MTDGQLEIIFRKSDVKWRENSRGWEMMLSYSFETGITSGYLKGTKNADIETLVKHHVQSCARSAGHPLFLPVLQLYRELPLDNDTRQRDFRHEVRKLEEELLNRYYDPAAPVEEDRELILENIVSRLHHYQCEVLWKRPQTWRNVVKRMMKANKRFQDELLKKHQQNPPMQRVHQTISSRLDFLEAKLDGLDGYTQITLDRMNMLRGLVSSKGPPGCISALL